MPSGLPGYVVCVESWDQPRNLRHSIYGGLAHLAGQHHACVRGNATEAAGRGGRGWGRGRPPVGEIRDTWGGGGGWVVACYGLEMVEMNDSMSDELLWSVLFVMARGNDKT